MAEFTFHTKGHISQHKWNIRVSTCIFWGLGPSIFKSYENKSRKFQSKASLPYFLDWMCSSHFEFPCPCKWQHQLQFLQNQTQQRCQGVKRKSVWIKTCSNLQSPKQMGCMKPPKHLHNAHCTANGVFQSWLRRVTISSLTSRKMTRCFPSF